jgi:hypothetical protein
MEYVIVKYSQKRTVLVDGEESGTTGVVLRLEQGTHTFSLSDPQDYKPSFRRRMVKDTTSIKPMEVTFDKLP